MSCTIGIMIEMFKCDCCGLCCMNLKMSDIYNDLNRGDGICRYFDVETKLCLIYENRPEKCNIDKIYEKYFYNELTREEYYELNYKACRLLKKGMEKECT